MENNKVDNLEEFYGMPYEEYVKLEEKYNRKIEKSFEKFKNKYSPDKYVVELRKRLKNKKTYLLKKYKKFEEYVDVIIDDYNYLCEIINNIEDMNEIENVFSRVYSFNNWVESYICDYESMMDKSI